MARPAVLPDFFILGAAKCGTTSVNYWLSQHPEICMSDPKEPVFFSTDYDLGLDHYWERYFRHWSGERLTGEASHRNLYHAHVPDRILATQPRARFLVFLRDPVERALSMWWHAFARGHEPLGLDAALRADLERVQRGIEAEPRPGTRDPRRSDRRYLRGRGVYRTYIDSGHYAEQLERYFARFDRERFKIYLLEDLEADARGVVRDIFEFLGVDPAEAEAIDLESKLRAKTIKWRPRALRPMLANFRLLKGQGSLLARLGRMRRRPPMPAATRAWLSGYYRPGIDRLEKLLGRSLAAWKRPAH
jgi:hypothetical protein